MICWVGGEWVVVIRWLTLVIDWYYDEYEGVRVTSDFDGGRVGIDENCSVFAEQIKLR